MVWLLNPVDGAIEAVSRRLSVCFLNCVAERRARPLNSVQSNPPSNSLVVSGLIPGKPFAVEARKPVTPSSIRLVRNVNFPNVGWFPALPYARRSFSSSVWGGRNGRRYDAENFGYA